MGIADEKSLADAGADEQEHAAFGIRRDVPEETPTTWDAKVWLAGVRAVEFSAEVVTRGDLVAPLQNLHRELQYAKPGDEADRIEAEFDEIREEFFASVLTFVVRARSSEWTRAFRKRIAAELDLTLTQPGDKQQDGEKVAFNERDELTAMYHQMAEQIVTPTGITPEILEGLAEVSEAEFNKVFAMMRMANERSASDAQVVTPGFSPRPSSRKGTAGSARR